MSSTLPACDLAIVGGGLVGASLALSLAPLGLRIVLLEAVPPAVGEQHPSFDERTSALANGTVRAFRTLGVWQGMEREAAPIRKIHVSDQGRFGSARVDAAEQGLEALGYVLPNRAIGAALWAALREARNVEVIAPARVVDSGLDGDRRVVRYEAGETTLALAAKLVVAADGVRSLVREQSGIAADHIEYDQTAITAVMTTQRFHDYVAYERFTEAGPIAILPLTDGRCGMVWTAPPAEAARLLALCDAEFLQEFQRAFGFRLGRFLRIGQRASYPLVLSRAERHVSQRLAVVGNAAQGLHPIAGQGFNLGLRDAMSLAEVIADRRLEGVDDPGASQVLQDYAEWRETDRRRIVRFTDGLVRLFSTPLGVLKGVRSLGLLAFDALPPAKSALARLSVGAAARVPRLARGVPLAGVR
ncbi:MAG TPA: 2-octaprenyl-6-methoxyphenyl hydroxylase [Steroidobacteraceae bacterium]|nr:2-octaprenyl-6-methoxyphenyl hydroxylase [Steroidobacteraceae bacterium]